MKTASDKVDIVISKAGHWSALLTELRRMANAAGLTEELKWRQPCYTFEGANVLILGAFKDHCVLSFFKGALLKDPRKLLEIPGPNTRSGRVMRFSTVDDVLALEGDILKYMAEAIAIEKAGAKVDLRASPEPEMVEELRLQLDQSAELKAAFDALTPGRRRWYLLHFAEAKQSKTRTARIIKAIPRILQGKGLQDRD